MSSIPVNPVTAKALFEILQGLEQRSGLTATPCVGTQFVQHIDNCSWQISELHFKLFVAPEVPFPSDRADRVSAAGFRFELYNGNSYVTSWRCTTRSDVVGYGPALSEFLDAVWERTQYYREER